MELKYKTYPAYKDSGVEWIRNIPNNWELTRLKNIFYESLTQNEDGKCTFYLSLLKDIGVIPFAEKGNKGNKTSLDTRNYRIVKKGDIVLNTTNVCIGSVGLSKYNGCMSSVMYIVLRPKVEVEIKYFDYIFKVRGFQKYLRRISNGILEIREYLNKTLFMAEPMVIPPLPEQAAIASFLDRKTALIDKAIANKQKLIALLKERRQILIQNAVTGKVVWSEKEQKFMPIAQSEIKSKDSGVEWIGEIPEDWEVKKVKHVTKKIGSGITPSGGGTTYLDEGGIPLLRSQNIHFGRIDLSDVARISENVHKSMRNSQVRHGDVLLNITGGSIGRCHYVETENALNVNQHVCIVRPKSIHSVFLNFVLASEVGQSQIWFFQQGGGREGLNFHALKKILIPFPNQKEQTQIVQYIETQSTKIDKAIALQQTQIEKLKAYKATLIDSAVTGKIKVC